MENQGEIRTDLSVCLDLEDLARFNRGEEVKGLVGKDIAGTATVPDIPLSWIVGSCWSESNLRWKLTLKKTPITDTCDREGPRWVEIEDGLMCIDNGMRILIYNTGGTDFRVEFRNKESETIRILFEGKKVKDKITALDDCREYLKRFARFVGAMPQRESAET